MFRHTYLVLADRFTLADYMIISSNSTCYMTVTKGPTISSELLTLSYCGH